MITEADFAKYDPCQKVLRIQDISVGCDQFVCLIETPSNKYIAKRPKEEEIKISNEVIATTLLSKKALPVPRVLYSEKALLIENYIEGRQLTENEPLSLYIELGEIVKKMHEVKIPGFGELIPSTGKGKFSTEKEYITDFFNPSDELFKTHPLTRSINVLHTFTKNANIMDSARSVLVHADIKNDNVLTDGSKIKGIIDFGDAVAGAPEYDLAWYYIHVENKEVWDNFLKGYEKDFDYNKWKFYVFIIGTWLVSVDCIPKESARYQRYLQCVHDLN